MISIIITSFKEEKTIGKAIEALLNQDINESYEIIVVAPDLKTLQVAEKYKKFSQVKIFKDAGKGKAFAINQVLPYLKGRIIILSDGDVFVSQDSINEILEKFKDKKVGAVSGHPVSISSRNNIFGFWSHLLTNSAHKLRQRRNKQGKFLECSGYLWAFRSGIIKKFPVDVAEDSIVPIMLWKKSYKIKYAEKAIVYVRYPDNLKDLIEQRRRAMQSHEKLAYYAGDFPKMKSFLHEIEYSHQTFLFPKSIKEFFWLAFLFPLRLYIWLLAHYKYYTGKRYFDGWKKVKSTK